MLTGTICKLVFAFGKLSYQNYIINFIVGIIFANFYRLQDYHSKELNMFEFGCF